MQNKSAAFTITVLFLAGILSFTTSCKKSVTTSAGDDEKTLTLQPAGAAGDNVSVYDYVPYTGDNTPESSYVATQPNHNFNGDTIVTAHNYGFESFNAANALFRFSGLSALPATATVTSASLYLYGIDSITTNIRGNGPVQAGQFGNTTGTVAGNTFVLQQIAANWGDGTVTWNNMPAAVVNNNITIPSSTSRWNNNDTLDITAVVKIWQANPAQNYGCRIALTSGSFAGATQPFASNFQQMQFYSSYASNAAVRPKLVVKYRE